MSTRVPSDIVLLAIDSETANCVGYARMGTSAEGFYVWNYLQNVRMQVNESSVGSIATPNSYKL